MLKKEELFCIFKAVLIVFAACCIFHISNVKVYAAQKDLAVLPPKYYINNNTNQSEIFNLTDGRMTVKVDVQNLSSSTTQAVLILALYERSSGKLQLFRYKTDNDICPGEIKTLECDVDVTGCTKNSLKVFMWNDLKQLIPLSEAFLLSADSTQSTVSLYSTIPDAEQSSTYSVTVNGQKVFVEKYKDISYARFSFSGIANISVDSFQSITTCDIAPHSFNIIPSVNGNRASFFVTRPRKIIVTLSNAEKLFIFADPLETNKPSLSDPNVVNIVNYPGIDNTGNTLNTAQIQQAINDVAARSNGGTLYFPAGKYKTGMIKVKSKVTLYLEDGALIQGTPNVSDYPRPIILNDGTYINVGALICFDQATNAKLTGRGVIDGDGKNLRDVGTDGVTHGLDAWLISIVQGNNIVVEDVILRDPAAFNSHICFSDNITYQRVKLINDIAVPNTDGIDPDSSRNIVIDDVFSYCSDDSVSVKSGWGYTPLVRDSSDIIVKNCVFWTKKSALKIGDETFAYNIHDIVFTNNDVVHADRAIVIYVCDGAKVSNVQYVNNRAEEIGGNTFKRLIDFWIHTRQDTKTVGSIENIIIKDFFAEKFSPNDSYMEGYDTNHKINNIFIDNFVVAGQKKTNLTDAHIGINSADFVKNVIFGLAPTLTPVPSPSPFVAGTFVECNGLVVIEAEHSDSKISRGSSDWILDSVKAGASGNGVMFAGPDSGRNVQDDITNSPQMNYKVNFTTTGTYYIWARAFAKDANSDSFHMGLDGVLITTAKRMTVYQTLGWYWNNKTDVASATMDITTPGIHTINIWMREDGMYLDKFLLMKATGSDVFPAFVSQGHKGLGPVESAVVQ